MGINLDPIKKALKDVSTLEVATLTNANSGKFDLGTNSNEGIFKSIRDNLKQSDLVAYTRFELDGDAVNFVNNNEKFSTLVEEHSLLVDSALETRKTLFNTIYDTVEGLL